LLSILNMGSKTSTESFPKVEEAYNNLKKSRCEFQNRGGYYENTLIVDMKNGKKRMFHDLKELALWKDLIAKKANVKLGKITIPLKSCSFLQDEIKYFRKLKPPKTFERNLLYNYPSHRTVMPAKHHEILVSNNAVLSEDSECLLNAMRNLPDPGLDERFRRMYIDPDDKILKLDEEYCWATCRMVLDNDTCTYSLMGEVPPSLVDGLERIFNTLWPALKQSMYLKNDPAFLEVIPKLCEYDLPPGVEHQGHWHVEGTDADGIVASAVHYLHVADEIEGGALQFRPFTVSYGTFKENMNEYDENGTPLGFDENGYAVPVKKTKMVSKNPFLTKVAQYNEDTYLKNEEDKVDFVCPTKTNVSVVFNNVELRHKVEIFSNRSETNAKRSFVSFFIVRPDASTESTFARSTYYGPFFRESWMQFFEHIFSEEPCRLICEYADLGVTHEMANETLSEVRAIRQENREKKPYRDYEGRFGDLQDWMPCDGGYARPISSMR